MTKSAQFGLWVAAEQGIAASSRAVTRMAGRQGLRILGSLVMRDAWMSWGGQVVRS